MTPLLIGVSQNVSMDTEMEQAQALLLEGDRNLYVYWGPEVSEQQRTAIFHRGTGFPAFGFSKSLVVDLMDRCQRRAGFRARARGRYLQHTTRGR